MKDELANWLITWLVREKLTLRDSLVFVILVKYTYHKIDHFNTFKCAVQWH